MRVADNVTVRLAQRGWRLFAVLVVIAGQATISAHEVVVEQIVEMTLEPQPSMLVVRLRLPAAVAGDPSLPGLLTTPGVAALEDHLRMVGADIARNLDIRQGDAALPNPSVSVRSGADRASIEVELRYSTAAEAGDFSARLNAFNSKDGPIRTNAHYRPESGSEQAISITGTATRIAFDLGLGAALSSFALRGLRALLDGGDQLLFLGCLLLPMRRPRSAAMLYLAVGSGQAIALASSAGRAPMTAPGLAGVALVAASTMAIAAIQNVARARLRWVVPVAVIFGALNGWTLGTVAEAATPLAGGHRLAATVTFASVVLLGELWLGALCWALRAWLDERSLPDRLTAILGSAIVAHSAVHRVTERAALAAQDGSFDAGRVLTWLTLAWVGAVLLAAISNAVAGTSDGAHAS